MSKNENFIAIYSRKSKFTGKGESIGNQVELCKDYIYSHFGKISPDEIIVYEDEGFSGGNLNRPDFKKMMEAARKRKFKAIIVYRLDRISRNISDFSGLIEELARLDIDFISIREQFDTTTPMGRAMMYIASVFSQLERETIAERIRDNMHELAKTGRWLGGTTPTGFASESVKSVTIDGKAKKACKLKLVEKEAEIVKLIYSLFAEYDSLTYTEAELLKRGIKSKNGKQFTRFTIKTILQNPVYMIADHGAYDYFNKVDSDLFSAEKDFDGIHGMMAYNRTKQERGKTTEHLPENEWIVSVGQHPGLIPSKVWISVQEALERNRIKTYRKPRQNEALLVGLLYCTCGSRMYPSLTNRLNSNGDPVYTYVCNMKLRSKRSMCKSKNANGNGLDAAITEKIKTLDDDKGTYVKELEKNYKFYNNGRENYEDQLITMRKEQQDLENKIEALVDSLAVLGDSSAKNNVAKRIEQLSQESRDVELKIHEIQGLVSQHNLGNIEYDLMRQIVSIFSNGVDEMTVEQKRAAIRTLVRKVVWDGEQAHVFLFGAEKAEMDFPDINPLINTIVEDDENDELSNFADIAYEDDALGNSDWENSDTASVSNTGWGEDSK